MIKYLKYNNKTDLAFHLICTNKVGYFCFVLLSLSQIAVHAHIFPVSLYYDLQISHVIKKIT